jgi:membrane-associated protein
MVLPGFASGAGLLLAVCVLLVVEECGVPLWFAPGDLLLAMVGLAIRTGRLPAAVAIPAVYLTTVGGALAGREIFALAGCRLERWFEGKSRLRMRFERAAGILRRGGWPAVLLARLTPCLRVYTTEAAGLLRLPRRTFVAGLLPSAAVYVGFCTGMGALVGEPALRAAQDLTRWLGIGVTLGIGIAAPAAAGLAFHLAVSRRERRERRAV